MPKPTITLNVCEECGAPVLPSQREIAVEGGITSRSPKMDGVIAMGPGAPPGSYHDHCLANRLGLRGSSGYR